MQVVEMKYPWHNQVCARCGITAELHRHDIENYAGGPMLPTCECREFIWSDEHHDAATPLIVKLERRVATLEAMCKTT